MKEKWINVAKALAIIAVLVDHTGCGILYTNKNIQIASYFSVPLFVLLMGISTYLSFEKSNCDLRKKIKKRFEGIVIPYAICVVVYYVIIFGTFDLEGIMSYILNFNITLAHYYVLLYIQLLVISPILFCLIRLTKKIMKTNSFCGVIILVGEILVIGYISSWATTSSNILNVAGGGGKLFGGSFLLLLFIGMLIGTVYNSLREQRIMFYIGGEIISAVGGAYTLLWLCNPERYGWIDQLFPIGQCYNPPELCQMLYAFFVMGMIFFGTKLLEMVNARGVRRGLDIISALGTHTLYIFLYHKLFLDLVLPRLNVPFNTILRITVYFGTMILGCILIDKLMKRIRNIIRHSYTYVSES